MKSEFKLTQPQRLCALFIDLLIVALACWCLFGIPYPPLGDKGFWAYSALLAVLVGSKLVTPFYVKPVDAISYAVPALVSLMLINGWDAWSPNQKWSFSVAAGFSIVIVLLGITNIVANSSQADWAKQASNRIRVALDLIGHPRFVYTPLILFAIFFFHQQSWMEAVIICLVTGTTVWWSFGDFIVGAYYRLTRELANNTIKGVAGQVVAFQEPGIVLIRQEREGDIERNSLLYISDKHGPQKLVAALGYVGRSEGILVRAVELKALSSESRVLIGEAPLDEAAYHLED